jgi:peptide chain release factor 1
MEQDSIIVEIRAGTGGDEAGLFARDLFRMYSRFGQSQGWGQKILDSSLNELGGYKEIIFELKGQGVHNSMKYEGGVHRVQRIPKTEKQGRVHTSTVTVAVLPKPKKTEININPSELKITTCKSSGPGGQYVNKTESAIRILHIPTGIVVFSQTERNQMQNKENAMSILAAKLFEKKEQEQQSQITGARKEQIGWAKRAEKMRTYNFPQDRITDHRIGKSWHNIEAIMDGKMEPIVKSFRKSEQVIK